jgi:hypothetical protein
MKNEISRILNMVESGKISAVQGSSLILAIKSIEQRRPRRFKTQRINLQASRGDYMTHPDFLGINPLRSCMEGMTYR